AEKFVKGPNVKEGMLNMVEMAFRAYDPCLACATHSLPGDMSMEISIHDAEGQIINKITRGI
ncbi:MAG: Ni/Fe hydrogenase subunit alpha, partial [Dehalococcoidaceae bacterium]|nr:Ni/Fe hydrogenase subunit alpha [Dehalococcoidaceae bacterium]